MIHTDDTEFGFQMSIGDVNFYPNGGHAIQIGCNNSGKLVDDGKLFF